MVSANMLDASYLRRPLGMRSRWAIDESAYEGSRLLEGKVNTVLIIDEQFGSELSVKLDLVRTRTHDASICHPQSKP
jgi:hypothetical protein